MLVRHVDGLVAFEVPDDFFETATDPAFVHATMVVVDESEVVSGPGLLGPQEPKPVTPQVAAMPGMTSLGLKP